MNRRKSLSVLSALAFSPHLLPQALAGNGTPPAAIQAKPDTLPYTAYLMAHFMENDQKLYYAYSRNALDWIALHNRSFVLDAGVNLRDPFVARVKNTFHLVHTHGWDFTDIYHWQSDDLMNWTGAAINVVKEAQKRAWAPEFWYEEDEALFYVFWASLYNGHNTLYYTTTQNWKDITPEKCAIYYDLGMDDIDLTIAKNNGTYYGFHKPGSLADNMGISLMSSPTLNPAKKEFGFGKNGRGTEPLAGAVKPIEGPQVLKLIGEDRWLVYADPFFNNFMAWETTDFTHFTKVPVAAPRGAKHGSLLPITENELTLLLEHYAIWKP